MLLPWFAYALPAVSVAIGGVFALKSFSFLREARVCARWPTAPGWVVRAQVKRAAADDGQDLGAWTTDQCHPNPAGHRQLADQLTPVIQKLLQPR